MKTDRGRRYERRGPRKIDRHSLVTVKEPSACGRNLREANSLKKGDKSGHANNFGGCDRGASGIAGAPDPSRRLPSTWPSSQNRRAILVDVSDA